MALNFGQLFLNLKVTWFEIEEHATTYLNKIAFQSKADHPRTGYTNTLFWLETLTLTRSRRCTCVPKINFLGQRFRELQSEQDTRTPFFAPVTLTLTRWPWYRNLTEDSEDIPALLV